MRAAVLTTSPWAMASPSSGRALRVDDRLSRGDPDAHLEPGRVVFVVEAPHRLAHRVRGPDCAFRIVLVRDRSAVEGHGGVADELLDRSAIALQLLPHARVVGIDDSSHVLGVEPLRHRGEADDVDEDDGDDLPLERELSRLELCTAGSAVGEAL